MARLNDHTHQIRSLIASVESKLDDLKGELARVEKQSDPTTVDIPPESSNKSRESSPCSIITTTWPLEKTEYQRYGRQMIVPEVGLEGQLSLKRSKILIVGLGGLGCPAATYLAGAGVGHLGLVDDDTISLSNLHRQTLYGEEDLGRSKVKEAVHALKQKNSTTEYHAYELRLTPAAAVELFASYDLILDCTDHPSSRYFISDAAVLTGKPLISASALRTEGQLMVLNRPLRGQAFSQKSFCYRCVFPKPPPPESIITCGEGGILGPVVGVMGILMAVEAIKILTAPFARTNAESITSMETQPSLLLYSAYSNPPFRTVRLKGKRGDCISCSNKGTITRESLTSGSLDYIAFCGIAHSPNGLPENERISAQDYARLRGDLSTPRALIDVREPVEFGIGHIDESINIPLSMIERDPEVSLTKLEEALESNGSSTHPKHLHFVCKLGNDSQVAVTKMREVARFRDNGRWDCKGDIKGGLWQWREHVDPTFPDYCGFPS